MTSKNYKVLLEWANTIGYKLHNSIERKSVNGVYGYYATDDIKNGDILFKSPTNQTILLDTNFNYDEATHHWVKMIHTVAHQYRIGDNCKYKLLFTAFDTMDYLKKSSIYFATNAELELISKLSPVLRILINNFINEVNQLVNGVIEIDGSLNKNDVLWIVLNWRSRAWQDGFVPILDLFNHSNKMGNLKYNIPEINETYIVARHDYKKGDQVYISYDTYDVYHYAINYNFYDKTDWKYISVPTRLSFTIKSELDELIFELISKQFQTSRFKTGDLQMYRILSKDIYFTEYGPTDDLIRLARCFSYETIDDLKNNKISNIKFDEIVNGWLNLIESANNVYSVVVPAYQTPRLQRFYDIQIDEFDIIQANRNWVNVNSKSSKVKQLINLRNLLFNQK
jgi:hypothetical protein